MYATPIKSSIKYWAIPSLRTPFPFSALHYAPDAPADPNMSKLRKAFGAKCSRILAASLRFKLKVDSLTNREYVILSDTYDNLTEPHFVSLSGPRHSKIGEPLVHEPAVPAVLISEPLACDLVTRIPVVSNSESLAFEPVIHIPEVSFGELFCPLATANETELVSNVPLSPPSSTSARSEPKVIPAELTPPSTVSVPVNLDPIDVLLKELFITYSVPLVAANPISIQSEPILEPIHDLFSFPSTGQAYKQVPNVESSIGKQVNPSNFAAHSVNVERPVEPSIGVNTHIQKLSICKLAPPSTSVCSPDAQIHEQLSCELAPLITSASDTQIIEPSIVGLAPPSTSVCSPGAQIHEQLSCELAPLITSASAADAQIIEPFIVELAPPSTSVCSPDAQIHDLLSCELAPPITVVSSPHAQTPDVFISKSAPPTTSVRFAAGQVPELSISKSAPPTARAIFRYAQIPEPFILAGEISPNASTSPEFQGSPISERSSPTATTVRFGGDYIRTFEHTYPSICVKNLNTNAKVSRPLKLRLRQPSTKYVVEPPIYTDESIPTIFRLQEYYSNSRNAGSVTDPNCDVRLAVAPNKNKIVLTRTPPGPGRRLNGNYLLFSDGMTVSIGYCDGSELTDTLRKKVERFCNSQVNFGNFGEGSVKGYLDGTFQPAYEAGLSLGACEYRIDKRKGTEKHESIVDLSFSDRRNDEYCAPGLFKGEILETINYNSLSQGYAGSGYAEGYLLGYLESGYLAGFWKGYTSERKSVRGY